jgi:YfiH family protein
MIRKKKEDLTLFEFNIFQPYNSRFIHYVASRHGGVSQKPYSSLNLSLKTKDSHENIIQNREIIDKAITNQTIESYYLKQSHSNSIYLIDSDQTIIKDKPETDGWVVNQSNILFNVLLADCVPIIFYDYKNHIGGAVHAGWKGTVNNIAGKAIEMMKDNFNSEPENILAGIGPSICGECFEVGDEVYDVFNTTYTNKEMKDIAIQKKKWHLDLWNANKINLLNKGLLNENIEISNLCSFENTSDLYSHRAEQGITGRNSAGFMLLN